MNDPKPKGKRLAEFAETDAILRLLTACKNRSRGRKSNRRTRRAIRRRCPIPH